MYTAPKRYTEDEINQCLPLSVARWHEHVNFRLAPFGTPQSEVDHSKFGFNGSIATKEACDAAGGHVIPLVFNWMVQSIPVRPRQSLGPRTCVLPPPKKPLDNS